MEQKQQEDPNQKKKLNKKEPFDYSLCTYECRVRKKGVFGYKTRYVYMMKNKLIVCKEAYKKFPDKIIDLLPEMKIVWVYDKNKNGMQQKQIGFKIKQEKEDLEYFGDEVVLLKLKESFSKHVFQARFQDEYDVMQQIGKGNYARVYSVINLATKKHYACKCFEKKKLFQMDKGQLSLFNELKVMRAITDHPNVIKLVEVFEGENTYYFVMELSEGNSLYDEIKQHSTSPFSDEVIHSIMFDLLSGVSYCASKNIMHRDLKPENLLFGTKEQIKNLKLVDFGLATDADEAPYIFPKCGTPGFVAPEIANLVDKQSKYSVVCDVFSVGVIFHILLTGEAVFPGKKFNEVLKKNKQCQINLIGPQFDQLSVESKDLLSLMLQQDPEKRITAEKALQHQYMIKKIARRKTQESIQHSPTEQNQTRPKNKSVFDKSPINNPQSLKYSRAVQDEDQSLGESLYTKEPLFAVKDKQTPENRSGSLSISQPQNRNRDLSGSNQYDEKQNKQDEIKESDSAKNQEETKQQEEKKSQFAQNYKNK